MIRAESFHVIAFPRERVWPLLSKTDWLNRATGLPPVNYEIDSNGQREVQISARARLFGQEMKWREMPFEWFEPAFYRVRRIFQTGPFLEARVGIDFEEIPVGQTRLRVYTELTPRNALGKLLAKRIIAPKTEREMRRVAAHLEEFLRGLRKIALPKLQVHPVNEPALMAGLDKLKQAGQPSDMIRKLGGFLRESPDVELSHIRPLALARQWSEDPWRTLSLFLHAPSCGLLDLRWEVLCPNCRSTRAPLTKSLSELKNISHCDVCRIKFDAEFDKSVELKFAVHPGIRPRDDKTFCLAGPGGKAHVFAQLWLHPGEERKLQLHRRNTKCRVYSPQLPSAESFELHADTGAVEVLCMQEGFQISSRQGHGEFTELRLTNKNSSPVLLAFEEAEWSDEILTASRITNWQPFRELFAHEVISPTESVTVGSQVILFTDLRGSTAMYQEIGDAAAYAAVRNHFGILMETVREHHGTLVKTIGDAVMAGFSRVDEALTAVKQMHVKLPTANPKLAPGLALKSSLHVGSCLAVNANDCLDYFGTTVNLAARMIDCCRGGDLTVSDELFHRPEMSAFLANHLHLPEPAEMRFRGFSTARRVWRIPMV